MGSIDLHQSAGLSLQPEAAQGIPQNLSTGRASYIYQTHPHTKIKKQSETTSGQSCSSEFLLIPSILRGSVSGDSIERDGPLVDMLLHV